jgi:hypothetical protein
MQTSRALNTYCFTIEIKIRFSIVALEI